MFFNKSILETKIFDKATDSHSHILPGVDDGIRATEDALNFLFYYESLGVERVIFTPHIMTEYHLNSANYLRDRFERFCAQYTGNIELSLGAEYMLDDSFNQHLESNDLLAIKENHLLVELSHVYPMYYFQDLVTTICSKGYFVLLAHPERYLYMDSKFYEQLKEMNVRFQLNVFSLVGSYGSVVQKRAIKLLMNDFYDCMGSDVHNIEQFKRWGSQKKLSKKVLSKLIELKDNSI